MAVDRGVITPWELRPSGRRFIVDDGGQRACFKDWRGVWLCGHDHDPPLQLQDVYAEVYGWTAQIEI
jgi:hypothetical protein